MSNRIMIYSKIGKTKSGKKFRHYWTKMNILVSGEEEKGKQPKSVTVKFTQDAGNTADIRRGILTGEINAPFKYEITQDENGEDVYPVVWVRKIITFESKEATHSQSDFILEDDSKTAADAPQSDEFGVIE